MELSTAYAGAGHHVVTAEEYRQKALDADLRALRVSDPAARLAYQQLAGGWRHLADHLDWLVRGRKGEPPAPPSSTP